MTPAARVQAVIEILDGLAAQPAGRMAPAEQVVNDYLRQRRYIGSKDRRAVTAMAYDVLRHRARIAWWLARAGAGDTAPRRQMLAWLERCAGETPESLQAVFDGARYAPPPLEGGEAALAERLAGADLPSPPPEVACEVPAWLWPRFVAAFGAETEREAAALLEEAPVDLRVNTLLGTREAARAALREEGIETQPTPLSPVGLRVEGRRPLRSSAAFAAGLVELQDEGSQLAALLVEARPAMAVADVCAGAGGKTLALAATMKGEGRLLAMDAAQARLDRSALRLRRAGVNERHHGFVERRAAQGVTGGDLAADTALHGVFDRVLVDAPCSGSGAWRRHPDARWRLTPEALERYEQAQRAVLRQAAPLVKPGGRLIYVTCSLLREENEAQVESFLADLTRFEAVPAGDVWRRVLKTDYTGGNPYLTLTPARHGTDGFFVAVLQRKEAA